MKTIYELQMAWALARPVVISWTFEVKNVFIIWRVYSPRQSIRCLIGSFATIFVCTTTHAAKEGKYCHRTMRRHPLTWSGGTQRSPPFHSLVETLECIQGGSLVRTSTLTTGNRLLQVIRWFCRTLGCLESPCKWLRWKQNSPVQ